MLLICLASIIQSHSLQLHLRHISVAQAQEVILPTLNARLQDFLNLYPAVTHKPTLQQVLTCQQSNSPQAMLCDVVGRAKLDFLMQEYRSAGSTSALLALTTTSKDNRCGAFRMGLILLRLIFVLFFVITLA